MSESSTTPPVLSYSIGTQTLQKPFVSVTQLKAHLALLHAFLDLKAKVNDISIRAIHTEYVGFLPLNLANRWGCFLRLSTERFAKWCSTLKEGDAEHFIDRALPPLDILMVWHSYMLNPGWYLEDCSRVPECYNLRIVGKAFSEIFEKLPEILDSEPSCSRKQWWSEHIPDIEFDIFEFMRSGKLKTMKCPWAMCANTLEIPYMDKRTGKGYLQNFSHRCSASGRSCNQYVKRCDLAAAKFVQVLGNNKRDKTDLTQYFAGTIFTPGKPRNLDQAKMVKHLIANELGVPIDPNNSELDEDVQVRVAWELTQNTTKFVLSDIFNEKFWAKSHVNRRKVEPIIRRILSAYNDEYPFSVDLPSAVVRQFSFSEKMDAAGWTKKDAFDSPDNERVLLHSLARYHGFMELMLTKPATFFVPTLDIDLAWHTHQLLGAAYESDCMTYIGRFIDHDDSVEKGQLSQGFDNTCKAWEARFGMRYAYCGCAVPETTLRQKLSLRWAKNHSPNEESMKTSQPNPESFAQVTHPSYEPDRRPGSSYSLLCKMKATARTRKAKEDKHDMAMATSHSKIGLSNRELQRNVSVKERSAGHKDFMAAVAIFSGAPSVGSCGAYWDTFGPPAPTMDSSGSGDGRDRLDGGGMDGGGMDGGGMDGGGMDGGGMDGGGMDGGGDSGGDSGGCGGGCGGGS